MRLLDVFNNFPSTRDVQSDKNSTPGLTVNQRAKQMKTVKLNTKLCIRQQRRDCNGIEPIRLRLSPAVMEADMVKNSDKSNANIYVSNATCSTISQI